jgi:hypothetical protein
MSEGKRTTYRKIAHEMVKKLDQERLSEVTVIGKAYTYNMIGSRSAIQTTLTYITEEGDVFQGTGISYKNPTDEYDQCTAMLISRGRARLSLGMRLLADVFGDVGDELDRALIKSVHRLPGDIKWKDVADRKRKSLSQDDITLLLNILDDEDMFALSADQQLSEILFGDV